MALKRLTDAQRKLVEDNLDRAKQIAEYWHRKHRRRLSFDEAYSGAVMGLVSKASKQDDSLAKFSTSASHRAHGQIMDDLRKKYHWMSGDRKKGNKQTPVQFAEDGRGVGTEQRVADHHGFADIDGAEEAEKMMGCLNDRQKEVIRRHVIGGETLKEIADDLGIEWHQAQWARDSGLKKMRESYGKHH